MTTARRGLLLGSAATLAAPLSTPLFLRRAQAQGTAPAAPTTLTQAPGFYRYKLGSLTLTMVHDGFNQRGLQGFVVNKPMEEVQRSLQENFLPTDSLRIPFTITFIETPRGLICFDSGNGALPANAAAGKAITNMRAAGIDPARVSTVIISHCHGDHINGLATADGQRAFPNAEVVVTETEWKFWSDPSNESRSPEAQRGHFRNIDKAFHPYEGRIRVIADDNAEVLPGIRAFAAHGHTPGHTVFHISDGNAQLMYVADCTNRPVPLALHPDYQIIYDFGAAAAEAARRRIYDQVTADHIAITGYHFPFPAFGHMAKEGSGYRFHLAEWQSSL
jgi:glyoxylase-like metal-dependent hydrolase (beta-lactamase superfamily II)